MNRLFLFSFLLVFASVAVASPPCEYCKDDNFLISKVRVTHDEKLAQTVWEITVSGKAGATTPNPAGQMNGAPVLGYVFPTSLKAEDVGFSPTDGIVALALTSHPDFDDTPLWDENSDRDYNNDGVVWHPHWVVLVNDDRVKGGLSVKQFEKGDPSVKLPPTNPGMPMYMDSPGFQVVTDGSRIRIAVPDYRLNHQTDFTYDGVGCYMQVNTEKEDMPMLGVYEVYSVASGDLSLPFKVK